MKQLNLRVALVTKAIPSQDGDGVSISRVAGRSLQQRMDPFLLLDEIHSEESKDYIGGFPAHPHRGFETITYMKVGKMRHRDSMGNEGVIESGDVQWMTAGKGVIHSEMPEQEEGVLHGFQLWLNLPADEKLKPSGYRDIRSAEIEEVATPGGGLLRVIAGEIGFDVGDEKMLEGPINGLKTDPAIVDVELKAGETVVLSLAREYPGFIYTYQGDGYVLNERGVSLKDVVFFNGGNSLELAAGSEGMGLLVVIGKPLREPVAQYGPFVMNTPEQVEQALQDYRSGSLV